MAFKIPINKGDRFGRLVATGRIQARGPRNTRFAEVECDCDSQPFWSMATLLKNGGVRSCGCLRREMGAKRIGDHSRKHGQSSTKLYKVWNAMKQRCSNPKDKAYHDYGARGIYVCEEWAKSFDAFSVWAHAHGYLEGLTIERQNNDGPYVPSNCIWIPKARQSDNTRRCIMLSFHGETMHMKDWSRKLGVPYGRIQGRIRAGWTAERALLQGVGAYKTGGKRATGIPCKVAPKLNNAERCDYIDPNSKTRCSEIVDMNGAMAGAFRVATGKVGCEKHRPEMRKQAERARKASHV